MNIKVIGLGGVGSILLQHLCKYLNYNTNLNDVSLTLIDGDEYEGKNLNRQYFHRYGLKSEVQQEYLEKLLGDKIIFNNFKEYVTENNINRLINDNDIIFLCVDNHKTRKIVGEYVSKLSNCTLISGGNEYEDGNVQVHIRRGGVNFTPSILDYHPEIKNPVDKLPTELSCEEAYNSARQLIFTNLSVSTIMCWVFYKIFIKLNNNLNDFISVDNTTIFKSEIYFDILDMSILSKNRKLKKSNI